MLGATILGKSVGGGRVSFFGFGFTFRGGMALNLALNSVCPKLLAAKPMIKINKRSCFIIVFPIDESIFKSSKIIEINV
jgi:hypothetical protein